MSSTVAEALLERRSVRGFLDRDVPLDLVEKLVMLAARAPSGGNLQPWHVDIVVGDRIVQLKDIMAKLTVELPRGEPMEYAIYPSDLPSPYEDRRLKISGAIYDELGLPADDRKARRIWFARNFQFFNAPIALFVHVDRIMGPPQWSDVGMFLQSFMLLAVEHGLATCPQECWAVYSKTMTEFLDIPEGHILFCGMAIGYEDKDEPANRVRSTRVPAEDFIRIHR